MNNTSCINCTTPHAITASLSPWLQAQQQQQHPTVKVMSYERVIQIAIHTFIFVAGLLGNLFVVTVILRRKKMRTVTNWFVFNLALSDLAIVLLVITTTNSIPYFDWPFGEIACRYLITPTLEHFAGVCVLTHTALSVARYMIVQHSMKGKTINLFHVKVAITSIWVVTFLTMSATLMGLFGQFALIKNPYTGITQCRIFWIDRQRRLIYRSIIFVLTYVLPMVATGFAYFKIYGTVRKSLETLSGHTSEEMLSKRRRKSRRMNRVLMTMYIMFGILTLPLQLLYFLSDLGLIPDSRILNYIWLILVALFYAQVVTNPFVLFYMGEEYRKELYKLPICCCLSAKQGRRIRKMSNAFRTSFKGHMKGFKKRTSNANVKHFANDHDSLGSKTGLVNEKRISTPIGSNKSYDATLNNGYHGYNYAANQNNTNSQKTIEKQTMYSTEQDHEYTEQTNPHHGAVSKRVYPNKENFQQNIGFYECLSYSLEQERSSHLVEDESEEGQDSVLYFIDRQKSLMDEKQSNAEYEDINTDTNDLLHSEQIVQTLHHDAKSEQLDHCGGDLSLDHCGNGDTVEENCELRDSVSAYYDDGTLLYLFDKTIGTISFEYDSGRETNI